MFTKSICVLFILYSVMAVCNYSAFADWTPAYFGTQSGKKVKDELISSEKKAESIMQCAHFCSKNESCKTVSFHEVDGSCHMSEHPDVAQNLVSGASWTAINKRAAPQSTSPTSPTPTTVPPSTVPPTSSPSPPTTTTTATLSPTTLPPTPPPTTTHFNRECPGAWIGVGNSCYKFIMDVKNRSDAKTDCEGLGGKLAEPQTLAAHEQLRTYMSDNIPVNQTILWFWIGLSDIITEGSYIWDSDNSTPTYDAWAPHEPGTHRSSTDCINLKTSNSFLWNNYRCHYTSSSVCELL